MQYRFSISDDGQTEFWRSDKECNVDTFQLALDPKSKTPMYYQIYLFLRDGIRSGDIHTGEKLPSLRESAKTLGVSITTLAEAYSQLAVEGYVKSQPKSGYYVSGIGSQPARQTAVHSTSNQLLGFSPAMASGDSSFIDPECFDFIKWRKCWNHIMTDYPHLLLTEGDPQGELSLRYEISRYAYQHRGVQNNPGQIIVGAGIQPIVEFLCLLLKKVAVNRLAIEDPGFSPVQKIFAQRDFQVLPIPVDSEGIQISMLPEESNTIVYVSPSNQFPLGSVMPAGKRYDLLEWAESTGNYILEDDYDSELRYYGKPIPSLQGMDSEGRVVYLGSFSSTLFPSIKISYMVLPDLLLDYARESMDSYRQTCSKAEQLTLALYMKNGLFHTHVKKLRRLYAQKMLRVSTSVKKHFGDKVHILQSVSGDHMLLSIDKTMPADILYQQARLLHLDISPVIYFSKVTMPEDANLHIFYFAQIPLDKIDSSIKALAEAVGV
jgi:GntR family transcriptional regulator / MocR family aminotransferase